MEMNDKDFLPEVNEEMQRRPRRTKRDTEDGSVMLAYLHDFVTALTAILLIFFLLFRVVVVSGPSMNRTLVDGDCLLLLSSTFYREPKQGDIIVASKDSFNNGEPIIKRIIAVEGQTVDIDFTSGIVSVDGVALEEPYTNTPTNMMEGVEFPLTVEKGCVFVMGDNRNDSKDSRHPDIGQIDEREILGKAILLILPGTNRGATERQFGRIGAI